MDFGQWSADLLVFLERLGIDPAQVGLEGGALAGVATAALVLVAALLGSGAASVTQALTGGATEATQAEPEPAKVDVAKRERAAEAEAPADEAPTDEPEPTPAVSDAEAIRGGLAKTRKGFLSKLNGLLGRSSGLDAATVEELETLLVTADVGIRTAQTLIERLQSDLSAAEKKDPAAIRTKLKALVAEILGDKVEPWTFETKPRVVMVVGVNGVGKTTTIGKLAARYVQEDHKVVLAAGDTFRAAAVEQLEVWGERAGAAVVKGAEGADPSSVVYAAIEKARAEEADLVLADTAGRLQTKTNLMKELAKVHKVAGKALEGAPHEVLMVLDATTGQNAVSQVKKFSDAVKIDALALTKLDGTAKGGVVVAIANETQLPVRFAGVGEGQADLRDFDPAAFVEALFAEEPEAASAPAADSEAEAGAAS